MTLRPLEVKSGPRLTLARVKLFLRRATGFLHIFSSAWPPQQLRAFFCPAHHRIYLKKMHQKGLSGYPPAGPTHSTIGNFDLQYIVKINFYTNLTFLRDNQKIFKTGPQFIFETQGIPLPPPPPMLNWQKLLISMFFWGIFLKSLNNKHNKHYVFNSHSFSLTRCFVHSFYSVNQKTPSQANAVVWKVHERNLSKGMPF
jgi:hypothetical protein